ncbi:MAG TPA: glycosyltransferase family 87 protein [Candidatus Limnocylindrales bacterium]|nr:glycosyltransferase family 87 protein [Candidatus Limnocylindrales bacterium]
MDSEGSLRLRALLVSAICVVLAVVYLVLLRDGLVGFDWFDYLSASRSIVAGHGAFGEILRLGAERYGSPTAPLFVYPPFLAYALIPATVLPWQVGYVLWSGLSIAALVWALSLLPRDHPLRQRWWILPAFGPLTFGFLLGQVDILVLAGLLVALEDRDGTRAGVGLAVAVILKATPAVFIIELLMRHRWRALAAGSVAALILAAVGGPAEWQTYLLVLGELARQPSVTSTWQVAPAALGGTLLGLVASGACVLAFVASPVAPQKDRRLIRGLALGLALTTFPMNAWAHWLTFGLVALFADAGTTRLGRYLLMAYLLVGWTVLFVGSVLILLLDLTTIAVLLVIEGLGLYRRLRRGTGAAVPLLSSGA